MLKPRMNSTRIHQVGRAQLPYTAQSLEIWMVNNGLDA